MGTTSSAFTTTPGFTGISQYSSDFQAELTKAAQIAQIPITLLQNQDTAVLSKESALGNISSDVAALASSVQALGTLASSQALSATSSDPSVVTAVNSGAAAATSYTINSITSAASAASEQSPTSYADSTTTPVSTGTLTLVIGGQAHTFSLTENDLNGLSNQINTLGLGVTASVVSQNGSNYLSLTAVGATSLQLFDGPNSTGTDLLTNTGTGTEQTNTGYADPASTQVSTGTLTLVSGSQTQTFQLASNNLVAVKNAINALNAGVTATILTPSGTASYLSVSANNTGATHLQLYDGTSASGTDLLTGANQGKDAVFQFNGLPVDQPGNVVNSVVPGLTFTILGSSTTPVTLSLASDPTQLSSALQTFVTAYNTVQTDIQAQTGTAGGPLAGDTILNEIRQSLQQLTGYTTSTGTVQSLADLGIEFSDTGVASFDQSTFSALSATQVSDAFKYLGSTTTGLGAFSGDLTQYSDPITGLIQSEVSGIKQTDTDLQSQIATLTASAAAQQTTLTNQFEAADAQQEELQQQQQELTASLQGLSLVLYGQNPSLIG